MHNFKDIGGLPGVAARKTSEERQIELAKTRLYGPEEQSEKRFTDPVANIRAMGLAPGMRIADFGSGSGAYALAAARAVGHSGRVYAVDVQKDLLTRTKHQAMEQGVDWIDIVWGDFETIGGSTLANQSLDVVILSNVLFQLDRLPQALAEAHRILKPGGKLILIDWTDSFGGLGPEPRRVVTKEKALEFGNAAGFTMFREFPAGEHHYGLALLATYPPDPAQPKPAQ